MGLSNPILLLTRRISIIVLISLYFFSTSFIRSIGFSLVFDRKREDRITIRKYVKRKILRRDHSRFNFSPQTNICRLWIWMNFQRVLDEIGNVRGQGRRARREYKRREKGTCACYLLSYVCVFSAGLFCTVIKAAGMVLFVFFKPRRREKGNRTDHFNPRCFTPFASTVSLFTRVLAPVFLSGSLLYIVITIFILPLLSLLSIPPIGIH